jgi:hypothetical protein
MGGRQVSEIRKRTAPYTRTTPTEPGVFETQVREVEYMVEQGILARWDGREWTWVKDGRRCVNQDRLWRVPEAGATT